MESAASQCEAVLDQWKDIVIQQPTLLMGCSLDGAPLSCLAMEVM